MIPHKKKQNLLQFKAEDIANFHLTCSTKAKSLTFGRSLYHFEYQQQHYWLKTQALKINPYYEQGFLNELAFYRQFIGQSHLPAFLLPAQIISGYKSADSSSPLGTRALILADAPLTLSDASQLSIWQIKTIILELLNAVSQLHQLGWIHGDLKKEHFMQYQQHTCLIDFEQVQQINAISKRANLTATPRYMAPELFQGAEKTVQTDIYALGIIFYEWLTGQRLTATSYQDWAYLHCQYLSIELPPHVLLFKTLLNGMLAKQTPLRFAHIESIKQHLITENV